MRLYVAGPITGYPNRNYEEFQRVQLMLETVGHDARIPHDFGSMGYTSGRGSMGSATACNGLPWYPSAEIDDMTTPLDAERIWRAWMWFDLHALAAWRPEGVVLIWRWMESRGARTAAQLFLGMGLRRFKNYGAVFTELDLHGREPIWTYVNGEMRPVQDNDLQDSFRG